MATNFRMNLISKCMGDLGTAEPDGNSLSEVLNGPTDIDLFQLRMYSWRHIVPAIHRIQLYKYMLRISSCYQETRSVVEKHRKEEAELLLRCLVTTRSCFVTSDKTEKLPGDPIIDIVKMILLTNNRMIKHLGRDLQTVAIQAVSIYSFPKYQDGIMFQIVKQVHMVCRAHWIDTFCIARSLHALLQRTFSNRIVADTIKEIKQEVQLSISRSTSGMNTLDAFWVNFDIELWLKSGFCSLLRGERAVQRVLDKLCTGFNIIPLLKALSVDYLQSADLRFGNGFKEAGVSMSEDGELRMVNRAIEQAHKEMKMKRAARMTDLKMKYSMN